MLGSRESSAYPDSGIVSEQLPDLFFILHSWSFLSRTALLIALSGAGVIAALGAIHRVKSGLTLGLLLVAATAVEVDRLLITITGEADPQTRTLWAILLWLAPLLYVYPRVFIACSRLLNDRPVGRRVVSVLWAEQIDVALLSGIAVLLGLGAGEMFMRDDEVWAFLIGSVVCVVGFVMLGSRVSGVRGTSLGYHLAGFQIEKLSGGAASWQRAIARSFVFVIWQFPLLMSVAFGWLLIYGELSFVTGAFFTILLVILVWTGVGTLIVSKSNQQHALYDMLCGLRPVEVDRKGRTTAPGESVHRTTYLGLR